MEVGRVAVGRVAVREVVVAVAVEEAVVHEAVTAVETREVVAALVEMMVPYPLTTHYLLPTPDYGRACDCFFSRSAYIWSALSRSISMIVSRRRSSSCLSFSMTFFSVHCGRRGRKGGLG